MDQYLRAAAELSVHPAAVLPAATLTFVVFVAAAVLLANRARRREAVVASERQRQLDEKMAALSQVNAELTGRLQTMAEVLSSRQSDLVRLVSERLDAVGSRVGQGLEHSAKSTGDQLTRLSERLAVIDAAQAKLTGLTEEVIGLKDILANKQARGAFGQGRMEAIVRDGLPTQSYAFQFTLSNKTRPDCIIRLPGDTRVMVLDAKFPLESFSAMKAAAGEDERRQAMARIRTDIGKHVRDMAERYFIAGETQDIAILFVPSESIYADLNEHFEDVVQRAHKARIIIVSPSLLMMAIQVMQAIVRDARMREQAHLLQDEVRRLVEDAGRLRDRVAKLGDHFRMANDDLAQIALSADKITKRGDRIDQMDLAPQGVSDVAELRLLPEKTDAGHPTRPASQNIGAESDGSPSRGDYRQYSTRRTTQR
ncbi:MAG TPA: DNA recombination protein RmuC [Beijerinckiaceae bacterium]|jgi:DNA recombination protein RmuC|nr:DNA recombination protein RmuC [Beijerinckiaceae bacterium]